MSQFDYPIKFSANGANTTSAQVAKVAKTTAQLNKELLYTAKAGKTAQSGLNAATKGAKNAANANTQLAATIKHASHMAVGTFGLYQMQAAAQQAIQTFATFQDMRTRLRSMSESSADYAEKEAYLIALAKEHHKELNSLANGYAGLSVMVKDGIINDEQARKMLEGLSNAASQTGADAENLKQVFYGLNQALGQGTLQAQELNQVVEPMPGLLSKIAKVAGFETGAQFKKLVGEGKVTSEMFSTLLVKALAEYEGAAAKTADNINAKFADLNTNYLLMVKAFEQPINNGLAAYFSSTNAVMEVFTENADTVVNTISIALNIAIIRGIAALTKYSAASIKSSIADRAKAQASLAAAKANETLAVSANHRAIQEQAAAKRSLANAANTVLRTKAIRNLAIANGNVIASERALIASRNALAVATKRASLAQRGLSAGLALLGGPAGVAMLAAYAIYEFASSTDNASSKADRLAFDVKKLSDSYRNLTANALKEKILDINEAIQAQSELVSKQRQRIKQLQSSTKDVWDNNLHQKITVANKLTKEQKAELIRLVASEERETTKLNGELALHLKLQNQLRKLSGVKDTSSILTKKTPTTKKPPKNTQLDKQLASELARIEQSLLTKEEAIKASYVRRQLIVDKALLGKAGQEAKYNQLSLALELQKDTQLKALAEQRAAAEQKIRDDKIQAELNARAQAEQIRRDGWDLELAQLQGYHSLIEAEEAAHSERVMAMKTRKTGAMQGTLMQFANWQKKTELEKTSAVISIGEFGFKAIAGQSKKAFAMYKAFSITQALIKTYEAATSAYSAMASIPVVGPALGVAAAAAAVAAGMAQVNQIKAQKPQGFAAGGNIGNNGIIEFGERNKPEVLAFGGKNYLLGGNGGAVFNQQQLTEINNRGGGDNISISTPITIQGNADESVIAEIIERNYEAVYSAMVQAKADRGEAA